MVDRSFEQIADATTRGSTVSEFWHLLQRTRKWWLAPLLAVLLLLGLVLWMSSTAAAPFIYTLF